jgi:hypothetical protein
MATIDRNNLATILTLLNDRLVLVFPGVQWKLVVCGGTALNALRLVSRTTKDIDVIGKLSGNHITYANFNTLFLEQIALCASTFDLPQNWLNTGPESYIKSGFPRGLIKRLTWKSYGESLHIGYIARIDQVFFKLYACVDRGGYHVDDLLALSPTESELIRAGTWCCEQDISEGFKTLLISMLNQLGFENVARKI